MSDRVAKLPGPDHPITIEANPARIVIRLNGQVIADTMRSLTLRESSYPAVHYIPRADVAMSALARSTHQSFCPYKGEAAYFSVEERDGPGANIAWSYEDPFPAMAAIKDHLAFYPDRVDVVSEHPIQSEAR